MNQWMTILAVGVGGGLGAMTRWGISRIAELHAWGFPWMTLAANLIGAVVIGLAAGAMGDERRLSEQQAAFVKTGFCGGLTTFSTFSLESVSLFESGRIWLAALYMTASIVLCLGGVVLGRWIAQ